MKNSVDQSVAPLSDETQSFTRSRPIFLWLASGFWLLSGLAGLIPIVLSVPNLPQFPPSVLLFVSAAALSQVLSLLGAVQLFRCKQAAIPLLALVFILGIGTLLLIHSSPASMSTYNLIIWSIGAATIGYALLLKRRGVLT